VKSDPTHTAALAVERWDKRQNHHQNLATCKTFIQHLFETVSK